MLVYILCLILTKCLTFKTHKIFYVKSKAVFLLKCKKTFYVCHVKYLTTFREACKLFFLWRWKKKNKCGERTSCARTRIVYKNFFIFFFCAKTPWRKIHKTDTPLDKGTADCTGLLPGLEHKKISRGRSQPRMDQSQWRSSIATILDPP